MGDKKLNILFISSWYPNKFKPFNGIFIKRHAAANTIDCNVSSIFVRSAESESLEESVEDGVYTIRGYYKLPKSNIPLISPFAKLLRYLRMWKKAWALYEMKKGKPDLINANIVYPVSIMATLIKVLKGIPYVITEHWSGYYPEDGSYKGFTKKIISKIAVANAGAVITDSFKLSRTMPLLGLLPKGSIGNNKYFTIPNVVDSKIFICKPESTYKPGDYFNFIHISSLDDVKNVSGIIRTFKKFHALHPLSKLTIVWDEESPELLEKITESETISEKEGIFLHGKKEGAELAEFLRQADAFVLFSNFENLPCVMLESFCSGVPVIGTRVGDVPDYINDKNGALVEPKNEIQLLEAMEKVYRNAANYHASEIRNMVLNKVSPAAVSKQFTDIYKTVISSKGSLVRNDSNLTADKLPLTNKKLKVLFVSSWYPNKLRPLHGIFVQRHAELLVPYCEVSTVYVTSADEAGMEINTINKVFTITSYFKKAKSNIPIISTIVKLNHYYQAWEKGIGIYLKEKGKPDIIQSNVVYPVSYVASCLSRYWKIPFVIMEHWSGYFPRDGRYKGFSLKFLSKIAVKRASAVATVSESLKQIMLKVNLNNKYYIIPNAVDTNTFTLPETPIRDKKTFQFIHVSFEEEKRKNVPGIIKAFSQFHVKFPDAVLKLVVEKGEVTNKLMHLAKSLGIENSISFTGTTSKEELVKLFHQSDAFVLFSDVETQAILPLEAMCCGLPVISSRCGGPEEYITPENGLLIDIADEEQLARAMEKMVKNRDNYNPDAIRNSVVDMVSENSVAKKFMQMYSDVLNTNCEL